MFSGRVQDLGYNSRRLPRLALTLLPCAGKESYGISLSNIFIGGAYVLYRMRWQYQCFRPSLSLVWDPGSGRSAHSYG